jgi:hypothetical protein
MSSRILRFRPDSDPRSGQIRYTAARGFDDATAALVLLRICSLLSSLASPTWRTSILVPFASTQKASSGRQFLFEEFCCGKETVCG